MVAWSWRRAIHNQSKKGHRSTTIDVVRGIAIAGVVLFHFVWDMEFTGFVSGVAFHPLWLAFGRTLAGTFMFLTGVSLVLAHGQGFRQNAFVRRLGIIAVAAVAISVVTYFIFPATFVFFGILHSIAVATLIGAVFLHLPSAASMFAGAAMLALPWLVSAPAFDSRWLAWIGLSANAPPSNDLVPVFPWAGLTLLGLAYARLRKLHTAWPKGGQPGAYHWPILWFSWMGRHSLSIYLIHQPVMLAIIVPISYLL